MAENRRRIQESLKDLEKLMMASEMDQNERINQFIRKIERIALSEVGIPLPPLINESQVKDHKLVVTALKEEIADLTRQLQLANDNNNNFKPEKKLKISLLINNNESSSDERGIVEAELDQTCSEAENSIQQCCEELERLAESSTPNEVNELQTTVDRIRNENQTLKNDLNQAQALVESYEMFNMRFDDNRIAVFTEIETLKSEMDKLRERKAAVQEDVEQIRENVEKIEDADHQLILHDEQIAGLEAALEQSIVQSKQGTVLMLANSRKEMQTLRDALADKEDELRQQKEQIELNKRLLRIRTDLITTMQSELDVTNTQLTDLQLREAIMAEEMQNLFSTLGVKDVEVARQREIIVQYELELHVQQRESAETEARVEALRRENAALKRKFNDIFTCRNLTV